MLDVPMEPMSMCLYEGGGLCVETGAFTLHLVSVQFLNQPSLDLNSINACRTVLCIDITTLYMYMYMEIHVYSTLAYVRVGREERQPIQTKQTMNMHVHVPVH